MISEGPKDGGGVASLVSNWSEVFYKIDFLLFFFGSFVGKGCKSVDCSLQGVPKAEDHA